MIILLGIVSVSTTVLYNCISNMMCKKVLTSNNLIYKFNSIVYAVCSFLFCFLLLNEKMSFYTFLMGVTFGVVTTLGGLYKMHALSEGPMHMTLLITTSSMIIPTMSGLFWGEKFSILKFLITFILIGFIYLSIGRGAETKINLSWAFYCLLAFIFQGSIGVLQKIHQSSVHRSEISGFLFVSFICSAVFCRLRIKGKVNGKEGTGKKYILLAVVCGLCTFSMNYINLKLSGILPSQLFFPLINGSSIIFSSLFEVFLFKERLNRRQLLGLAGGIGSLILMCIVP